MLVKKDILTIFRNIKKINKAFYVAFFNEKPDESLTDDFLLSNEDFSYIAYSDKPRNNIKSSCIVGADDIEYFEEAIKNADTKDNLYLSLEDNELSLRSLETLFYKCKVELCEEEITVNKTNKVITRPAKDIKNNLKLVITLADKKGYAEVPYIYAKLDENIRFYSFTPWVASMYKLGENIYSIKDKTLKFNLDNVNEVIGYLPGGVNAECDINMSKDGKLIFIFNNCESILESEKADNHSFLDTFFNLNYDSSMDLDREKLKTMLGKMKGIFGDTNSSFIFFNKEDEKFVKIETGEYSFKVPYVEITGDGGINVYGRYIKEAASKITSDGIILMKVDNIIKIVSENQDLIVTSMVKRDGLDEEKGVVQDDEESDNS